VSDAGLTVSKLVKLNYSIYSVPITYTIREGETKIAPIKDGFKILFTFFRNLFWSPPKEEVGEKNTDQQIALNISALNKPVDISDADNLIKTVVERETGNLKY